ncbi:MAG: helix-turn-helix transcriptional regulator [Armatimonadetes bacterium]|nr:helix-turn-helix transcriptional regulator [Armatimonadota bacterium]MDE2206239.1 helix-turn-helix transcriptional regulator [Armatimonadota bacterium]
MIRNARVKKGVSLRTFAGQLDITPSYQSDIENDRRIPAEDVLRRTAALLALDVDDLLDRAGRLGDQTERYLRDQPTAYRLFRRISQRNLNEDELQELLRRIEQDQQGGE